MFDAIALSNGWGDATAALQLLSHLQGDALNVALLIPMPRRASRKELTDALSAHYGSPGRLANYRQEFSKTVWKSGEDPSNFAIALETLAVKAFGDMGQVFRLCTTGYAPLRYSGSMSSVGESCRSRGTTSQQTDAGAGLSGLCGQ